MTESYQVLSPWAEADAVPARGLAPGVDNLAGKTVGLFLNTKPGARPIMAVVERRLREKLPGTNFAVFQQTGGLVAKYRNVVPAYALY
jgi:hypothetical protein